MENKKTTLPLLPLRDVVIFPHMVIPLFVGRTESIKALESSMSQDKQIFLVTQKDGAVDAPAISDLYEIGVIATVLQLLHLPDGTVKVLVEGIERAKLIDLKSETGYFIAKINPLSDIGTLEDTEVVVLMRSILNQFEELIKLNKKIPVELLNSLRSIENPGHLADNIAAHLSIKISSRQEILDAMDVRARLELLHKVLSEELDLVEVEKRVQGRVKEQVEKSQRQYYLREKIAAIQKELGEEDGGALNELKELQKKIEEANMPLEAKERAESELNKLKMMSPMSAEATVSRNYLDVLIQVPWAKFSKISDDLEQAEAILDAEHFGLKEVKERIIEYLAVLQRAKKIRGPILCLVGPPGVGKTSLGQSIANATGREFVRISLGGVRDEAEIRGHRRTYIGALPGKIIQKLCKAKVRNPLFMLDEVDKMAMDFRGDPASALLEVLDPEQNFSFNDHYLELDYDLSDVMFIATANSMDIPAPLLDRMEVIRLAGYTEQEKLNIAKKYLIPRQIERTALKKKEIGFTDGAILEIIRNYTREAGVRNLEREISKLCRKVMKSIILKKVRKKVLITQRSIEKYLGVKRYRFGLAERENQVGQVTGLAWTEVGGEMLTIEAQVVAGKGKSLQTGRLGDVMQESIQAAMTVVRSRSEMFGIEADYFQEHDFHVHVPEGATPKDGPSAGIAMCTALVSALTRIPVRADVAMTGEITLRGKILPIGGLKEKLLAALRGGIKTVIIPEDNRKDLKEIPPEVMEQIQVHPVQWIDQVLQLALTAKPEPLVKVGVPALSEKEKKSRRQQRSTH